MARTTAVSRTMNYLRGQGCVCAVVERWNQYAGTFGLRQDLFGIVDVLVLDPSPDGGFIGIQVCGGADFKKHVEKLTIECAEMSMHWLNTPGGKLEIWGWRKLKVKRGGKAERWTPRIQAITKADLGATA